MQLKLAFISLLLILSSCVSSKKYKTYENPNNLFPIGMDGKWGFVDSLGTVKIDTKFDSVQFFKHGMAVAKKDGKFGYINSNGAWIIKPRYDQGGDFYYGCAETMINGQQEFITRRGKINKKCELWNLIPGCLVPRPPVNPHEYSLEKDGKIALTNNRRTDTTDYIFDSVQKFSQEFIVVSKDHKLGFYSTYNNHANLETLELQEAKYDEIRPKYFLWSDKIEDGNISWAEVKRNGYWGILNARTLEESIKPIYHSIHSSPSAQYILVEFKPNHFGYIDYSGYEFFKR